MHLIKAAFAFGALLMGFRIGVDAGRKYITPSTTA